MYISKSRFINWTRCPMYFPMELKHNPSGKLDTEIERRKEMLEELSESMTSTGFTDDEDEEKFDATPRPELEALLPYYNQEEDEALKVAKKYFHGTFIADSLNVQNQKLFEYEQNGHTYRCYVDIYNENEQEINIIEVKATTNSKYIFKTDDEGNKKGLFFSDASREGTSYPLFVKGGNIWHFNEADSRVNDYAQGKYKQKKESLLNRYSDVGKYPHDLAFQRFVIEHALCQAGDNRPVNYYLAVLNSEYVYDGAVDENGRCLYHNIDGQEIITFLDLNETTEAYQTTILKEIAALESYISTPHDVNVKVDVGKHCAWGANTECLFWKHCFQKLRDVPDSNSANKYLDSHGKFKLGNIADKYQLINEDYYKFDDVPLEWLEKEKHLIQRDCYDNGTEYIDKDKMQFWFDQLEYPIYHSISRHSLVRCHASTAKSHTASRCLSSRCISSMSLVFVIKRWIISFSSTKNALMMNARIWPKPLLTISSLTRTVHSKEQCSHRTQVLRLDDWKSSPDSSQNIVPNCLPSVKSRPT